MDTKPGTKVDKSGQKKESKKKLTGFHSGKRLKYARDLDNKRNKDLIWNEREKKGIYNLTEEGLQGWYKRHISKAGVIAVANFFGVDEWIFSDEYSISREEFKKLFTSGKSEAPPPSRKSRLALFPVHFFHQDISKSFSAETTNKEDVSAAENEAFQDVLLPNEIEVPYDWEQVISSSSSEEEYHFHKGCECNEKREYEQAVFNLDKVIRTNTLRPDLMVRAYHERGYSRYKKGDLKDAWQDYLKSLQTEPDNPFQDMLFNWYSRNNGPESINEFTELAKTFPDSAVVYYLRGLVALDLKDYDSAVADFTEAIELEPESGNINDFYALRGYAFYQKELYSNAIDEFTYLIEKGIILSPEVLYFRVLSYEKEDRIADAIEDIKKCLHADPNQEVFLKKFNALKNTKKR